MTCWQLEAYGWPYHRDRLVDTTGEDHFWALDVTDNWHDTRGTDSVTKPFQVIKVHGDRVGVADSRDFVVEHLVMQKQS